MKVIVNVSGFYGGTWFEGGVEPVNLPDRVASQFLPPRGDQLSLPAPAVPLPEKAPRKRGA